MKPIDIIMIVATALIVVAIVAYIIIKKIKGEKVGCGCGCSSCPHASACGGANSAATAPTEPTKPTEKSDEQNTAGEKENDETV